MSTHAPAGEHSSRPAVTLSTLQKMKKRGEKFTCLTAYDACFGQLLSEAGVEVTLIGDSLGMVLQGHDSTLPVSMDDMVYHISCVKRGNRGAFLIGDMPFMSYASETQTLENAARLMRAGAQMIKLEGGAWIAHSTHLLAERGIPVCAHMGLTPQSINRIGGYHVQGRDPRQAESMLAEARLLESSGASILLLECVPQALARTITEALEIPVIWHRRRTRHRWPGHGAARPAWHLADHPEIREELPQGFHRRHPWRAARLCEGSEGETIPGIRA